MATILEYVTKDGNTRYKVQVRIKGHPTQTCTFSRLTDAKKWGSRVEAAIEEGRHNKSAESKRRTFSELVDRYINSVVPIRHNKVLARRAITCHLNWWKEHLGPYFVADINPARISELRDQLLSTPVLNAKGKPVVDKKTGKVRVKSTSTVVRYLASLSVMYSTAVDEWGWAESNPVQSIRRPPEPQGRVRFLNDDERTRFLKACEDIDADMLYPAVILALSTGARQGELLTLKWSQVDFEREVIRLEVTKNKERRALPLVGYAHSVMKSRFQRRRKDTDLVFPRSDGKAPLDIKKRWARAISVARLENFRFHDLRHCAASYLAMNGATLAEIAEVLGHKTLQMVKRYAHLSDQHTAGVVKRMNDSIFKK